MSELPAEAHSSPHELPEPESALPPQPHKLPAPASSDPPQHPQPAKVEGKGGPLPSLCRSSYEPGRFKPFWTSSARHVNQQKGGTSSGQFPPASTHQLYKAWEAVGMDTSEWHIPGTKLKAKFLLIIDLATKLRAVVKIKIYDNMTQQADCSLHSWLAHALPQAEDRGS